MQKNWFISREFQEKYAKNYHFSRRNERQSYQIYEYERKTWGKFHDPKCCGILWIYCIDWQMWEISKFISFMELDTILKCHMDNVKQFIALMPSFIGSPSIYYRHQFNMCCQWKHYRFQVVWWSLQKRYIAFNTVKAVGNAVLFMSNIDIVDSNQTQPNANSHQLIRHFFLFALYESVDGN